MSLTLYQRPAASTFALRFHIELHKLHQKKPQSSLQNFYICIMEIDEEKYRQFTEKLEKELQERRAIMELEKLSIAISVCGIIFGAIPYFGWLYLFFSFGYCCYAFKKTWSSLAFTSIIICILMLFVKYCLATIDWQIIPFWTHNALYKCYCNFVNAL